MGDIRPATILRRIAHDEKVADLVNELKQRTFRSRTRELAFGLEHAIISKTNGTRWLVRGGEAGIDLSEVRGLRRLIAHTHGAPTGPSWDADFPFLIANRQKHSYLVELGNPSVIRFNSNGTDSIFRL